MEELICREGTVHSVIFQNAENGYTVLRLLTEEGEVVTVVGISGQNVWTLIYIKNGE